MDTARDNLSNQHVTRIEAGGCFYCRYSTNEQPELGWYVRDMSYLWQGQRALLFEDVDFVGRVIENFHRY
jgi:hypothetical protein